MGINIDITGIIVAIIAAFATITAGFFGYLGIKTQAQRVVTKFQEQIDTGNEKRLGETVHDIAISQELMSAQLHTNAREILNISVKLNDHLDATTELVKNYQEETIPTLKKLVEIHKESEN